METIEQLQQNNAKLQERLNNAAKFFKEQKAQIESLTKENEELQSNIKSKDKAYEVLQNTYNEVWAENIQLKEQTKSGVNNLEDLQKQLNEYKLKLQNSENTYEELQKENELSEKQIAKLMDYQSFQSNQITTLKTEKESFYKQIDEYELKLKNSEASYEQLNKKYEARKQQIAELTGNIEVQKNEYENKITSLKDDINKKTQEIEKLQIEKSDLEVNINDLTSRLSESVNGKTKYQEFTEMIIDLVESFNNNGNNIDNNNHSSITVNTYKNSTGSQFMTDAPGMNI